MRRVLRENGGDGCVLSITVVLLSLFATACAPEPTQEDVRRLEELRKRFGGQYAFTFEAPMYVRAQQTDGAPLDVSALEDAFEAFWYDDGGVPRKNTSFVYLNAYDRDGRWQLQLFWNPEKRRIVQSKEREHY